MYQCVTRVEEENSQEACDAGGIPAMVPHDARSKASGPGNRERSRRPPPSEPSAPTVARLLPVGDRRHSAPTVPAAGGALRGLVPAAAAYVTDAVESLAPGAATAAAAVPAAAAAAIPAAAAALAEGLLQQRLHVVVIVGIRVGVARLVLLLLLLLVLVLRLALVLLWH